MGGVEREIAVADAKGSESAKERGIIPLVLTNLGFRYALATKNTDSPPGPCPR